MSEISLVDSARSRSVLYHFFAQLTLQEPSTQAWEWMMNEDTLVSLHDIFIDQPVSAGLINGLENLKANGSIDDIEGDYQELFKVPGENYLFPYESCYLEKGIDGSMGFVMGETTKEIAELYRRSGASFNSNEMDDFIGIELLFMYYLTSQESKYLEQGQPEMALRYHQWQLGFLNDHLLRWSDQFFMRMKEKATTTFYQSLAYLVLDFLQEEMRESEVVSLP